MLLLLRQLKNLGFASIIPYLDARHDSLMVVGGEELDIDDVVQTFIRQISAKDG